MGRIHVLFFIEYERASCIYIYICLISGFLVGKDVLGLA